jgi:hypothetical protein
MCQHKHSISVHNKICRFNKVLTVNTMIKVENMLLKELAEKAILWEGTGMNFRQCIFCLYVTQMGRLYSQSEGYCTQMCNQ